jgi:transposase
MSDRLSAEEVAILIKARQIQKAKGLTKDADVKSICEAAGVSRKTGYQWTKNLELPDQGATDQEEEMARLKTEYEDLKKKYIRLEAINEGHKLAWEIHGVDELLAAKKNTMHKGKRKNR